MHADRPVSRWVLAWAAALACFALPASAQSAPGAAGPVLVRFTTSMGAFTVALDATRAPLSTANFVQYVRDRHYDGTVFHRVIGGFVVQAGGYLPDLTPRPPRTPIPNESGNGLSNRRGTVALARQDDPHSATSQFYVNLADNLSLDPGPARWGYAVIGLVIEGMDVIDRIASVPTGTNEAFGPDVPVQPVVIESARLVEVGGAAPSTPSVPPPTAH
jgi:cyclophilin family peptidyl-prolyl cis-trans isomerase